MNRTSALLSLPSIAVLLALSGCASQDTATVSSSAPSADTVEIQSLPPLEGADENGEYAPDEATLLTARCMQEAGVDVDIDVQQVSFGYESEDRLEAEEHETVLNDCADDYPTADPSKDWSDVMWHSVYDAEVRAAECYRAQGLPVGEVPAFEQFREDYATDRSWTALGQVAAMDQVESYQLAKTCPAPGHVGNEIAGQEPLELEL